MLWRYKQYELSEVETQPIGVDKVEVVTLAHCVCITETSHIDGLKTIKNTTHTDLPLGFWVWHDQIEDQHAAHTDDELSMLFEREGFCQESFMKGASAILDAVKIFWDGLEADRLQTIAA